MLQRNLFLLISVLFLNAVCSPSVTAQPDAITVHKGDRILFVGDTFADRLRVDGYVESILAARRPELELVCHTLGWSGDTLSKQPRPLNFGSQDDHLQRQAADVVVLCFGMSQSLDAPQGAAEFGKEMTQLISHLRQQKYNGHSAPQLVLVSPIAHEFINSRLGNPSAHNASLKQYVAVLHQISEKEKVPIVDLFDFTSQLMKESASQSLTTNGIHLNSYGYWAVSHRIADLLIGKQQPPQLVFNAEKLLTENRNETGLKITGQKKTASGIQFQVQQKQLPLPLPPKDSVIHNSLENRLRHVSITHLKPGNYALKVDGKTVFQGDQQQFANSFRVPGRPAQQLMRELQSTIRRKDQWFFERYRPVNTEYIFGRRTQPYGVESFPPELKKVDELIAEQNHKIHIDANQIQKEDWKVVRLD